jgi:hypothetical protein
MSKEPRCSVNAPGISFSGSFGLVELTQEETISKTNMDGKIAYFMILFGFYLSDLKDIYDPVFELAGIFSI